MEGYLKLLQEDRRLCILKLLKESNGSANESVLQFSLELLGHTKLSRQDIRDDLNFLTGCGLIRSEFYSQVQVGTITRRGVEVAEGRDFVEGVKRPSIGV